MARLLIEAGFFLSRVLFIFDVCQLNQKRSSKLVLLQDQGLLIRKGGVPRGYGLANEEMDVGYV